MRVIPNGTSAARRVYALADAVLAGLPEDAQIPQKQRKNILDAAVDAGINYHTARTMLYRWSKYRGRSLYRLRRGLI